MEIDWHLVFQVSPPRRALNKGHCSAWGETAGRVPKSHVWKVVAMKSLLWGENPQASKCQTLCLQKARALPWQWTASQRLHQHPSSCLHKNLFTYHSNQLFSLRS